MTLRLYVIPISNPCNAVRGMLAYKGIEYRLVKFAPGFHPVLVHAAGFPGWTVPALEADGRKLQHSLEISRFLDELEPEPPLFPADPEHRRAVEEAERWGEANLQPVPRRIFRQAAVERPALRRWLAAEIVGLPLPAVGAALAVPITRLLAGAADASGDAACADVAALPRVLDHVDALIADGTIGGPQPNAADFQILATVGSLGLMVDLHPALDGRPCQRAAQRLFPGYDGLPTPPDSLPAEWLTALR